MSDRPSRLLRQSKKSQLNQILTGSDTQTCDTCVGHIDLAKHDITHGNHSTNQNEKWVTDAGHITGSHRKKHRVLGIFRRGTVWQFKRRVPNDVVDIFGREFVKQSLKTSDYRLAVKVAVRV